MKKSVILLLLLLVARVAPAASIQSEFDQANRLYQQGRYAEALAAYQRLAILASSWKIHFNAGNALYKNGRWLEAKVQYLKARRLDPANEQIEKNIQVVNRRFRDRIPATKPNFLSQAWLRLLTAIGDGVLAVLLLASALATNFFLFLILKGKKKRLAAYGAILSLLLFLLFWGYGSLRSRHFGQGGTGVVRVESAELRSGPGTADTVLFKVNLGLEVQRIDRGGEWVQVAASPQIAGWIKADAILWL